MSLFEDREVTALSENRWSIECLQMRLQRQSDGEEQFIGGGHIKQTAAGELSGVLYDTTSTVDVMSFGGGTGRWLGPEDYSTLTATDTKGRQWTAEWVDVDTSSNFDYPGAIVRCSFRELARQEPIDYAKSGLRAYALCERPLPLNAATSITENVAGKERLRSYRHNLWRAESDAVGSMIIEALEGGIDANISFDTESLPEEFPLRLAEGLTFVLAAPIQWLVEETVSGGQLRTVIRNRETRLSGLPRLEPPLRHLDPQSRVACGQLLTTFVRYTLSHPPPEGSKRHPLSLMVSNILRSSGIVEDESLGLSTQVERLVREYFGAKGASSDDVINGLAAAVKYLDAWNGDDSLRKRILSAVQAMKGTNPRTALRTLVGERAILESHFAAWERVRPVVTHGLPVGMNIRELVGLNNLIYQMFLLLVFRIIGYHGPFSDYTRHGFPPTDAKTLLVSEPPLGAV